MGIPTDEELSQALRKAGEMREKGEDPDFIAKSLLSLNYRYELQSQVIDAVKLYLHSGHGATEHALLVKALEKAESASNKDGQKPFGLS